MVSPAISSVAHTLTLWTNNLAHARWANEAGVDRIGLDLESIGKSNRQKGLGTWISHHGWNDLNRLRRIVPAARLFVRLNGLHSGSEDEIARAADAGVGVIMQPNFTKLSEVERFVRLVDRRAQVVPLVERRAATEFIERLPALGIREIHIGLNDLSIDLGQDNRLAVLAQPIMSAISAAAIAAGLRFGLGGLGRARDRDLPVPSDLVYAQHARLKASGALLARSFFGAAMTQEVFINEIARLRRRLREWSAASVDALETARLELERRCAALSVSV